MQGRHWSIYMSYSSPHAISKNSTPSILKTMWLCWSTLLDGLTHSQLLKGLKCESKWKTSEEGGIGTHSLAHNTLRDRGACWSSGMGLRKVDKLVHPHGPAHNPHKWLVHSWSTFGARMSHGQHGHTRLTTARIWGKPPPSPL